MPGPDSEDDRKSLCSLSSSGTMRDSGVSSLSSGTASYRSDHIGKSLGKCYDNNEDEDQKNAKADPDDSAYSLPPYLVGSTVSVKTGSRSSLVSEGEVSFGGHVSDRLGTLLGYGVVGADKKDVEGVLATIMGYEIRTKNKEIFTVYKIQVSHPSLLPGSWFIHRRYSDFLQLRAILMKENKSIADQLHFPPKRWVGSNLDPIFLGRRLAGLQVFLASALEINDLKKSPALLSFLCLDSPPVGRNGLETNMAVFDTLKEVIKDLREQLMRREQLDMEVEYHRNMNNEKDKQIQNLVKENQMLKRQKQLLMKIFAAGLQSD
eukprot:GFUD01007117.1.p1 GENE.GFUD01007117.1~~GFUD01007117.1.p1  ORF type:complete len:320 (+),score=85.31 GFUD01007117.1:80-1039(+)